MPDPDPKLNEKVRIERVAKAYQEGRNGGVTYDDIEKRYGKHERAMAEERATREAKAFLAMLDTAMGSTGKD